MLVPPGGVRACYKRSMASDVESVTNRLMSEAFAYAATSRTESAKFHGDDALRLAATLSAVAELLAPMLRELQALRAVVAKLEAQDS